MSVSPALSLILNTGLTALPEIAVRAKLYIGQGLLYGLHEYKLFTLSTDTRVFPINFDDKPIFLLKKPLSPGARDRSVNSRIRVCNGVIPFLWISCRR